MKISFFSVAYKEYTLLRRTVYFRAIVWGISKAILLYQKYISRHTCLYSPTCSQYMLESVNRFGPVFGVLLGSWRLLRCNPLSKGGYDPVPEKFWHAIWLM